MQVTVINDDVFESTEHFILTLSHQLPMRGLQINPAIAEASIIDEARKLP